MSGEGPITDNQPELFRWWLLPSWLGLDAPCVALTWAWATGRASGVALHARSAAAMFLVVWFIYLSDRLIDVARCRDWTHATGRLRFGRSARPLFGVCLVSCLVGILTLLWAGLPVEVIQRAAVVALGVGLHGLLFVIPILFRTKLPGKEFGVGLFFALGAYACLGEAARTWPLLVSVSLVVTFACLVIAARDADSDRVNDPGGASRWWSAMNRDLYWIGIVLTLAAALAPVGGGAFGLSLTATFAALTALHGAARRLNGDVVRALADALLLMPVPIIGVFALL